LTAGAEVPRRVALHVRGIVQGVCYRASTQTQARRLGLTGWVRNEPDGSVRAVAEGPEPAVRALVAWCEHGPPHARVDQLEASWSEATGAFTGFVVAR
jgi:acylphosphatase